MAKRTPKKKLIRRNVKNNECRVSKKITKADVTNSQRFIRDKSFIEWLLILTITIFILEVNYIFGILEAIKGNWNYLEPLLTVFGLIFGCLNFFWNVLASYRIV